ncbi:MAG: C1 family peptidase [Microscillaceae bacterium]|jgi:C1A family cysteine protease|nr:C1 family peptidase [Microscillaceae bacterium]
MKNIALIIALVILGWYMPRTQAQDFGTGCKLNVEEYRQVPLSAPLMRGDYVGLPSRISLRRYAPIPQNQGAFGTCVGWSTAYSARTIMMASLQNQDNEKWINENALSPFFIYEQAKSVNDIYCQEGTSLPNALEIIKQIGVVRYKEFGNQCGQVITGNLEQKATQFKIRDYKRLFEPEMKNKIPFIKKSLAENKPVIVGIQCCAESFLNAKGVKIWKMQATDTPNPSGGHALTVIGYDDNMEGGAVELMNSWGTTWGEQGFIWMKYEDFNKYCFEAYEMSADALDSKVLSGSLKFVLSAGETMLANQREGYYEMIKPYHSGTLFRLYISNNEPAYMYAFSSDLSKKNYKIFPATESISPFLSYKGNNVAIPDEDHFLQMDNTVGTDYFCVLYSLEKLDIEQILQEMEKQSGNFQTRLRKVLGDKMLNPRETHYLGKGEIGFKAYNKDKKVIPIIVSLKHI